MNNLEVAKQALGQKEEVAQVITKTAKKKTSGLPLQRDIYMIQDLLNTKIREKENEMDEKILKDANMKYQKDLNVIHMKAIALGLEAEDLAKRINTESNGMIRTKYAINNGYRTGYLCHMPENLKEANEEELFEIENGKQTQVKEIKKEIELYVLNLKIGVSSLADVKQLLEKIDNIKT